MKTKTTLTKRLMSLLVCAAMVLAYIPAAASAADIAEDYYNRVVDVNTMDNWVKYFDPNNINTANAGGVWTDKSVFKDADAFDGKITMLNENKNFLTALSALAANKEVVGYSTVPTDTVLVLDLSGSMEGSESSLIGAANNAIKTLLETNENNRVGVVLYSASGSSGSSEYDESVTRILPIDRYTTGSDGVYLSVNRWGTVSVDGDVEGTVSGADLDNTKSFGGGTYIQAGLWEAMKMFQEMDTVIGDNNWQSGDDRMPILVLMSDGAPSTGTSYYADVENSQYTTGSGWNQRTVYESNVGNGNESGLTAGNAFLTQLTAAYVMSQIEAHYQAVNPDVRGLFYTLGFNIGSNDVAQSVMNPDNSTLTDSLWTSYNALTNGSLSIRVKSRSTSTSYTDVSISKNSYVTSKSYVDEYFSASGTGLADAFGAIVDEIILQSRYYPTHLEGGSPDFSGYVEFTDVIGEYMEVKDIKGILLGDTLFDGCMMASKLTSNADDGLGTVENPTALGDEFIRAIKTRLGIADTATAQALVANAFGAGQLKYNSATDWSNYIGWYAKADGTYAGFWNEGTTTPGADAVYKIKSYGFLGETTGSIKNSDMMYMSVQVRTNIATGEQTVLWKIPASLVPLITYSVTLEGTNVDVARNVHVEMQMADPIRLVFESGLRSDLNELNSTRITDEKHIAEDGVTRQFWSNYFDISAPEHDQHKVTLAEFTPSKENERFYYTFDSAVFKKTGENSYALVEENEGVSGKLNENNTYYHRRYIFTDDSNVPIFLYEQMSKESIQAARYDANFETLTGEKGAWEVPAGTPARELQMYDEQKDDQDNIDTKSAHMVFHPYLTEHNNVVYVDMNLGNNGLLEVTPAQGLKLSKTVDIFETGTSDAFQFQITIHNADGTPYTGKLNSWITALDVVPLGASTEITIPSNGVYTVDLSRNQTFWLTGIPAGATYTIEEVSTNEDYKVKSVHVNGVSLGSVATGTVAAYYIDDVDFVNTAVGEGNLVITKQVVDANGNVVDVADSVKFTAEVTLTNAAGAPVSGNFSASNGTLTIPASGKFTITLSEGESFVVRGIPEETRYTVEETNIPRGFALNREKSVLSGTIDSSANDQALIVNTYKPMGTNGADIDVQINKLISGNRTDWMDGESYTFTLEQTFVTRAATVVATATIDADDTNKSHLFNLSSENYTSAGTYYYRITESVGTQGGITYDTAERRFNVVVADSDMDGDLEIVSVNNEVNTTVSGNYTVTANFNNVYQPTGSATATIDVVKKMDGDYRLNGFQFALFDSADIANADEIVRSTVTDAQGNAKFTLTYAANRATMAGEVYTYYLAELNTGNPNITYDTAIYEVKVTIKDNGDGTISAATAITPYSGGAMEGGKPTFTNTFVPSDSAYVTLTANKTIEGDRVLNANEFVFVIEAQTTGAPMPANTTVRNAVNGAVVFDTIEFTAEGVYKYKIYESKENPIGGFTYDGRFYEVTVTVTDNGNAQLLASVTRVVKENENDTGRQLGANEIISFENAYEAKPVDVILSGEKFLTGKTMQGNDFQFRLEAVTANAPMPNAATVMNTDKGVIPFDKITYTKAGTYVYKLTEVAGTDDRFDYDESVYEITVIVTDNSRGVLSASVTITKNGVEATGIAFRNGFVPDPISYDIYTDFGGKKALEGRPLEEGEFEFALINAINGQQIGQTVKNDAAGEFKFPAVTIPEAGIYHYKITEVIGDESGVSYDTSSFHIRLEVVQDDNGVLSITDKKLYKGTVTKEDVGGVLTEVTKYENITATGKIQFNNHYEADPVYVTIEATKTLTGRDLVDGEFKFDLHKTDSTYTYNESTLVQDDVVLELQDDGTGSVVFMPEMFDAVDTYYYVVLEDEVDENGVVTHKTPYKVEITVTDNHNGNLKAALKVDGQDVTGSTATVIQFRNTYNVTPGTIKLGGLKKLQGRDLKPGEFTFNLYFAKMNGAGQWEKAELVEQVTNMADGTFAFEERQAELGVTYIYFITEDASDPDDTITYDKAEYMIVVTSEDNLDGTMKVIYTYTKGTQSADGVTFVNKYAAPPAEIDPPKTGDDANLMMGFTALLASFACLAVLVISRKRIAE